MKVTPDKLVPIIPKATTYQGDCLFPVKKAVFELFLSAVSLDMPMRKAKYPSTNRIIVNGAILQKKDYVFSICFSDVYFIHIE